MKLLLVCCLAVSLAFAQDDDLNEIENNATLRALMVQENYESSTAEAARLNHLFCLSRETEVDSDGNAIVTLSEFEQRGQYVWTLFLQIPLISYLDPRRKISLFDTIMKVLNNGNTFQELCIGTYETYQVSYFRESVLVHVYGRNMNISAQQWSDQFNENVNIAVNNASNNYVIPYPGQGDVVAIDFSTSDYFTNLLQPNLFNNEGVDLTGLAVLIGSYGYNYTFSDDDIPESISRPLGNRGRRNFADNTNPINYGLEPGDIVFAVFGSILVAILLGLIILGYCIHPFFIA